MTLLWSRVVNSKPISIGLIQLKSDLPFHSALKESKIDRDQNGKRHAKPKFDNCYLIKGAMNCPMG